MNTPTRVLSMEIAEELDCCMHQGGEFAEHAQEIALRWLDEADKGEVHLQSGVRHLLIKISTSPLLFPTVGNTSAAAFSRM